MNSHVMVGTGQLISIFNVRENVTWVEMSKVGPVPQPKGQDIFTLN